MFALRIPFSIFSWVMFGRLYFFLKKKHRYEFDVVNRDLWAQIKSKILIEVLYYSNLIFVLVLAIKHYHFVQENENLKGCIFIQLNLEIRQESDLWKVLIAISQGLGVLTFFLFVQNNVFVFLIVRSKNT